jgi:hypothetical protein
MLIQRKINQLFLKSIYNRLPLSTIKRAKKRKITPNSTSNLFKHLLAYRTIEK